MKKLRVVLAQLKLTVGDISGNLKKHLDAAVKARDELAANVIVFPELSLVGYPAEDLLLRKSFIDDAQRALDKFTAEIKGIHCIVGHPYCEANCLYNACSLVFDGKLIHRYHKQHTPNYGVFDERRYFEPGVKTCVVPINNIPTGMVICEDIWKIDPARHAAAQGAKLLIIPNASPFEMDKHERRVALLSKRATNDKLPILYVNQVCGQDDIIFDGGSLAMDSKGNLAQFAGFFNETLHVVDIDFSTQEKIIKSNNISIATTEERIYQALVLSVHDYINKNNCPGVIVGVSGGIDSALTLAIAVDALGKDRVLAVKMPSRYTADISDIDADELIKNLGVESKTISIEPTYEAFLQSLKNELAERKPDITEENIQARCRAIILMALANKSNRMVLTTGNRSELAVGYCTLYGDMAGGYAVLKDVPKTLVYQLSHYRNQRNLVIPKRTLERAPTAELAPGQKDQDTLPPYAILDQILERYLNLGQSIADIVAQGFDEAVVKDVVRMIHKSEHKRKQGALGPHINHKSFIKDWRYPVTSGYKD